MVDFKDALRAEIAALEAQLQMTELYQKLQGLRSVLSLYDSGGGASEPGRDPRMLGKPPSLIDTMIRQLARENAAKEAATVGQQRSITRVPSEARAKAMELAELFLRNRSAPTPTRDILEHILANGGEIGGQEPVSNLSAMLSNSDKFQSHGRIGWTLAQEHEAIPSKVFTEIAEDVLADLETRELQDLHSVVNERHQPFPADLDGRILAAARRRVGRLLTDHETRELRNTVAQSLATQMLYR